MVPSLLNIINYFKKIKKHKFTSKDFYKLKFHINLCHEVSITLIPKIDSDAMAIKKNLD